MEKETLNQKKNGKVDSNAPAPARVPGGYGLRSLGPYRPRPTPAGGAWGVLASSPARGSAAPLREARPRARPGKTTARNFG